MHTVADGLKCLARGFRIDLVGSEKLLQACARDTCPAIFAESQLLTQNMRSANKIKKKSNYENIAFPRRSNYNVFKKLFQFVPS